MGASPSPGVSSLRWALSTTGAQPTRSPPPRPLPMAGRGWVPSGALGELRRCGTAARVSRRPDAARYRNARPVRLGARAGTRQGRTARGQSAQRERGSRSWPAAVSRRPNGSVAGPELLVTMRGSGPLADPLQPSRGARGAYRWSSEAEPAAAPQDVPGRNLPAGRTRTVRCPGEGRAAMASPTAMWAVGESAVRGRVGAARARSGGPGRRSAGRGRRRQVVRRLERGPGLEPRWLPISRARPSHCLQARWRRGRRAPLSLDLRATAVAGAAVVAGAVVAGASVAPAVAGPGRGCRPRQIPRVSRPPGPYPPVLSCGRRRGFPRRAGVLAWRGRRRLVPEPEGVPGQWAQSGWEPRSPAWRAP